MDKQVRYCAECGKPLKPRNLKYCSNDCFKKDKAKNKIVVICKTCGKEFTQPSKRERIYCSSECSNNGKRKQTVNTRPTLNYEELNRPFTNDTPYLVNLWHHKHGNSFEEIAIILNRSLESVKEAYRQYVQSKEVLNATRIN